ncbi:MAG TPA: aminopeptidase, partial [Gammaproteobacteria bacterium]|nr:aminopeptidase [Gammaproteobacteria bacterium]
MMKIRTTLKFVVLLGLSILLISCETVSYYSQAARGQLEILTSREGIQGLLQDPQLPVELREQFELVLQIREFAALELQLPVADNYSTYVDLGREHVVWNVFAAPEFSTQAVNWCYPIAGCVSYRGYFSESSAEAYARKLEQEGFDVYTGGVDAYSTLGWFDDSLLSSVVNRSAHQLAGLIFHELAHLVVFAPGDTTFNESFATAVEREGIRRWARARGEQQLYLDAEQNLARQAEFVALVSQWRDQFDVLYSSDTSETEMREQKQGLQQTLRVAYEDLKESWSGYDGYDAWFARELNNAQLSTVASYNDLVPAFDRL